MPPSDDPSHVPAGDEAVQAGPVKRWRIAGSHTGQRLDAAIARELGLSRQQVKTLLDQQAVLLNGRPVPAGKKGLLMHEGSELAVTLPDGDAGNWRVIPQPELPLSILAQGPGYMMLDKPAGMPVHPLSPGETGTLLNAAIARFPQMQGLGEAGLRSGVVHRLDVETSGVLVMATQQDTWQAMRQAFVEHRTTKFYTAIVSGHASERESAKLHLTIAQHRPARVKVVDQPSADARLCDLSWQVIRRFRNATLIHVQLGTGFLHQIRVMMAHLGHPVVGDAGYGQVDSRLPSPPRLMLHAHHLELLGHAADSPMPEAMVSWLQSIA